MIKTSYVIPRLVLLALLWAFFYFAFDPLLKWGLVKGLEKAAGAKAEIANVATTLFPPSFRAAGVAVGNASEPMTNAVEFAELSFRLEGAPLLEKKFVMDSASLSGLRFGTPRKTSARLPLAKEETPAFVKDLKSESRELALDRLGDLKAGAASDLEVSADSLESPKVYETLSKDYEARYAALKEKADAKVYEARMEELRKEYDEARGEKNPLKQAKSYADLAKKAGKLTDDFNRDRKAVEEAAAALKDGLKAAEEARRRDLESVMAKMKLPSIDTKTLARTLAGPAVAGKADAAFRWLAFARKYMPDNSKKAILKADSRRGRVISFPKEKSYPSFLIRKMALSGELGLEDPLAYSGTVEGITSQPRVYGKPLKAEIKGAKGMRRLDFRALADATGETLKADMALLYAGAAVSSLTLGSASSIGASVTGGTGALEAKLAVAGDKLAGRADFRLTGAKVAPSVESVKQPQLKAAVSSSLASLTSVGIGADIGGTIASPALSVDTDLADRLNSALKAAMGAEFDKARAQAQAKVDAALKPYKDRMDALTSAKQKELRETLDSSGKKVSGFGEKLLKDLKGGASPSKIKLPKVKF